MIETPSFRILTLANSIHGALRNGRRAFIRGPRVRVMVRKMQQSVLRTPGQTASAMCSVSIRKYSNPCLNEKFNVQYIMAGRAAGECTEIL
jgi:hypothetical protein